MPFNPEFLTTLSGSVPYMDTVSTCQRIAAAVDIPCWPQMVNRSFRENMYVQYAERLPAVIIDDTNKKIAFDTTRDITPYLEPFYQAYLDDDVEYFGLTPQFSEGFFTMQSALSGGSGEWIKGHITGPISMGLSVTDQNLRASLYDDILADTLVKNAAMHARWQVRQLKSIRPNAIIFVDEPYMASFGSAYISLSRECVVSMLNEVFASIHLEGGLAGVHCCANTDWSVLLETQVDILNLDAYGYLQNLALYPGELRKFLDRGGIIAWGIVPNNKEIHAVTPTGLAQQLKRGIAVICEKAAARGISISPDEFNARSLITPACGLGPARHEDADRVLSVLHPLGEILRGVSSMK